MNDLTIIHRHDCAFEHQQLHTTYQINSHCHPNGLLTYTCGFTGSINTKTQFLYFIPWPKQWCFLTRSSDRRLRTHPWGPIGQTQNNSSGQRCCKKCLIAVRYQGIAGLQPHGQAFETHTEWWEHHDANRDFEGVEGQNVELGPLQRRKMTPFGLPPGGDGWWIQAASRKQVAAILDLVEEAFEQLLLAATLITQGNIRTVV